MNEQPDNPPDDTPAEPEPEKLPFLPKRKRRFLVPIIILLSVTLVGSIAGVFIGFASVKSSDAYKVTFATLEDHHAVKRHVGTPIKTGLMVLGSHDDRNGTYDLTFTITGPHGSAAVRSRCEQERSDEPWVVTHLDIGVGGRQGNVYTLVGDPENPPGG